MSDPPRSGNGPDSTAGLPPTLREALPVWGRVAAYSFGGPAGQIAVMHRILVEEKRWIGETRFLHALNFCMMLPGPEAQQLATYVGWSMHRWRGALLAGGLFVLPGFLSILALSVAYALFQGTSAVEGLFLGLKPAVLAVVVQALVRIGRRAVRGTFAMGIAGGAFCAIFAFGLPFPLIIGGAALLGALRERIAPGEPASQEGSPAHAADDGTDATRPSLRSTAATAGLWLALWWLPVALLIALTGRSHVLVQEAVFFSKTAVLTFGGAYAVLSYVAQQAVATYGWLLPGEMLDGLGMAETTPGPLIQVVQFVGFMGAYRTPGALSPLFAGILGSIVTTWVTFTPCFLWILTAAPYVEYLRGRRMLRAALVTITAAVVGVILNLSLWFATHTLFTETRMLTIWGLDMVVPSWPSVDPVSAAIALLSALMIWRGRGMLEVLAIAALIGTAWTLAGG